MINDLKKEQLDEVNRLLSKFKYNITLDTFNNDFFRCLIYYEDGIKGVIVYDLIYDRIEIEYIIVHEECRKQGIGSKLLNELEKNNIKNITLEVRESNITAIEFYQKNGYRIEAVRKNYYGTENGYLMLKELGD